MIMDIFIQFAIWVLAFFNGMLNLFQVSSTALSQEALDAMASVGDGIKIIGSVIPLGQLFAMMSILFATEYILFRIKAGSMLAKKTWFYRG